MANVKMSFIGLLDMLRFKNMKVQRDKIIESTPEQPAILSASSSRLKISRFAEREMLRPLRFEGMTAKIRHSSAPASL